MNSFCRSLLSGVCFFLFGIGGVFIGSILFPLIFLFFGKRRRFILVAVIHYVWRFFVWIMSALKLIKVELDNSEKLQLLSLKRTVVVANHPSLIDIVILISLIPNSVCIVKGSLAHNIWMSFIIRMIFITNDGNAEKLLNDTKDLLNSGFNVIIFPEGTRTKFKDDEHKLHRGFAQIALHSCCDILPIVISCVPPVLGKEQHWWNVGDRVSIFYVCLKNKILFHTIENDESFHEKAKEITAQVRKILFY